MISCVWVLLMKKIVTIALFFILICSFLASATTKLVLEVNSDEEVSLNQVLDDIRSHPVVLYFKLGVYYFYQGKFENAIKAFGKAVELNPDFAEAHHNIGVSYYELDNIDSAIVEFKKAVEVNNNYVKGHYSLALAYYEKKDYDNAIDSLKKVVELNPLNADAYFDLGIIYVEKFRVNGETVINDLEQGVFFYNECVEINPEFPHAKENLEIVEKVMDELLND